MKSAHRSLRRISLRVLRTLVILIIVGAILQVVVSALEMRAHPAPGELVDVGGYRLHWYCQGQGETTVILVHALGGNILHWDLVQPEIAQFTRVCAYDRAGYGWSETGSSPRTPLQNARELNALLKQKQVEGKIILVGHSYGTSVVQFYAREYPEQIQGIVLIDGGVTTTEAAICPGLTGCMPAAAHDAADIVIRALPVTMRIGVGRLLNRIMPYGDSLRFLSDEQQAAYAALTNQTKAVDANAAEWTNWDNQGIGEPGSLAKLPLYVIHAEATFPAWIYGNDSAIWQQRDAAIYKAIQELSQHGQLRVVPGADHASLIFDPSQRLILVEVVRTMLEGN